MTQKTTDRYISFQGIDCDGKAHRILSYIEQYVEEPPRYSPWLAYFQKHLSSRISLGQDDLYFVGSQINSIRSLFEDYDDTEALALLEQLEEDCC